MWSSIEVGHPLYALPHELSTCENDGITGAKACYFGGAFATKQTLRRSALWPFFHFRPAPESAVPGACRKAPCCRACIRTSRGLHGPRSETGAHSTRFHQAHTHNHARKAVYHGICSAWHEPALWRRVYPRTHRAEHKKNVVPKKQANPANSTVRKRGPALGGVGAYGRYCG